MAAVLIPTPAYDDVTGAIDMLVEAFGFEVHARYDDAEGTPVHVELTFGNSMIMLASPGRGEHGDLLVSVDAAGKPTSGCYVVVDDVDAHYARAAEAGIETVIPPRDRDHGGRDYTCRDAQGHLWTFGSYDPWSR